jgi:type II secretory pathway pseudopilin PulG
MGKRKDRGISLIEIVIALAVCSILTAGAYATFTTQQKTHAVQEQVIEVQQNARAAVNQMIRELRAAGFGNVSTVLPAAFGGTIINNVVNPNTPENGAVTIVSGSQRVGTLAANPEFGANTILVIPEADADGNPMIDLGERKYISIGGIESFQVVSIAGGEAKTLTLNAPLLYNHRTDIAPVPIFGIRAITYRVATVNGKLYLERDDHLGAPVADRLQADDIEAMQLTYLDANGNVTATPADIRLIRLALTARTDQPDPAYKDGDGYRRRELAANIRLKNMTTSN